MGKRCQYKLIMGKCLLAREGKTQRKRLLMLMSTQIILSKTIFYDEVYRDEVCIRVSSMKKLLEIHEFLRKK